MRQPNKNGLGYTGVTSNVATTSKTLFVKAVAKTKTVHDKNFDLLLFEGKKKKDLCIFFITVTSMVTFILNALNIEIFLKGIRW